MKRLCTTAFTAALMAAAVMSIASPAQAQARLAWWGWPGLVAAPGTGNPYATAYGYALTYSSATGWSYPGYGIARQGWFTSGLIPGDRRNYATAYVYAPTYTYATGWSYPGYGQYQPYSSSGGYGMWNNPWYNPFTRRHAPRLARAARHWQ
jgi:hypothetical protein